MKKIKHILDTLWSSNYVNSDKVDSVTSASPHTQELITVLYKILDYNDMEDQDMYSEDREVNAFIFPHKEKIKQDYCSIHKENIN